MARLLTSDSTADGQPLPAKWDGQAVSKWGTELAGLLEKPVRKAGIEPKISPRSFPPPTWCIVESVARNPVSANRQWSPTTCATRQHLGGQHPLAISRMKEEGRIQSGDLHPAHRLRSGNDLGIAGHSLPVDQSLHIFVRSTTDQLEKQMSDINPHRQHRRSSPPSPRSSKRSPDRVRSPSLCEAAFDVDLGLDSLTMWSRSSSSPKNASGHQDSGLRLPK